MTSLVLVLVLLVTPNVVAGVVTATKFVGNTPGTVSGIADGTNINAGIITATVICRKSDW